MKFKCTTCGCELKVNYLNHKWTMFKIRRTFHLPKDVKISRECRCCFASGLSMDEDDVQRNIGDYLVSNDKEGLRVYLKSIKK